MNRVEIETNLIQSLRELSDDKLAELFDFAGFLKSRLTSITPTQKSNFVNFIQNSPLYGVELVDEQEQTEIETVLNNMSNDDKKIAIYRFVTL